MSLSKQSAERRGFLARWLRATLLGLSLLLGWKTPSWAADPPPPGSGEETIKDLKTILEKGLRARRPEEFEFIQKVVGLVDDGDLPRDLVMSTFNWARKKPDTRRVVYFQQALIRRAEGMGIHVLGPA